MNTIRILFTENDYFDNSEDEGNYHSDKPFLDDDHAWEVASRLREDYSKACLAHPICTLKKS
jgi:hypothetical protein